MRNIRPPRRDPAPDDRILLWAREAQQCFRDIAAAFGEITLQRTRPGASAPPALARELRGFELVLVQEGETDKVRVVSSTLAGGSATSIGFAPGDDPPYLLTPVEGVVQGGITIDADGLVTSRWIECVEALGEDTDDTFYVEIGTVGKDDDNEWIVSNSRYGPIGATICRRWFVSEAPFYGVTWL